MKNILKPILLCAFISLIVSSCSNEKEEHVDLSSLNVEFDYPQFKNFTIPISDAKNSQNVMSLISKNVNELETALAESTESIAVNYIITHRGNELVFEDFIISKSVISNAKTGGPSNLELAIEAAYTCPSGQSHVATCFSKQCVEDTLGGLSGNFSSGESISMYHAGFGGVKICSNVK